MRKNHSNDRKILILSLFFFGFSAMADDIVMATNEDLKEFDHLISQEPPKPPADGVKPLEGQVPPPDKDKKPAQPNPRGHFEGETGSKSDPKKGDKKGPPPKPFDQRPPPGAANPGDGQHQPPPPPPPGGLPPPPPRN